MYEQLSDQELIAKAREMQKEGNASNQRCRTNHPRMRDVQMRTKFYTPSETALTGELQRRGMIDGDGQIRNRPVRRKR